jgi:hypothetical protein
LENTQVTQATVNCTAAIETDQDEQDPAFVAECIRHSSHEFALDLGHHLNWMRERAQGADLIEVERLNAQLVQYLESQRGHAYPA